MYDKLRYDAFMMNALHEQGSRALDVSTNLTKTKKQRTSLFVMRRF